MKQTELAKIISKRSSLRLTAVNAVLRNLALVMTEALEADETIRLGIGIFEPKMRPPKPAYDFKAKKKITLPPATYVAFRPSSRIQQVLKEKDAQLAFDFAKQNDVSP